MKPLPGRIDRQQRGFAACAARIVRREVARHLAIVPHRVVDPLLHDRPQVLLAPDPCGERGIGRQVAHIGHGIDAVAAVGNAALELGMLCPQFGGASRAFDIGHIHPIAGQIVRSGQRSVLGVPRHENIADSADQIALLTARGTQRTVRQRTERHAQRHGTFARADITVLRIDFRIDTGRRAERHDSQHETRQNSIFHSSFRFSKRTAARIRGPARPPRRDTHPRR